MARDPREKPYEILNNALEAFEDGHPKKALRLAEKGMALLRDLPPHLLDNTDFARAYQLQGEAHLKLEQVEPGLRSLGEAERLFEASAPLSEEYGQCLFNIAGALLGLNDEERAHGYLIRAQSVLKHHGEADLKRVTAMLQNIESSVNILGSVGPDISDLRQTLAQAKGAKSRMSAQHALASGLLDGGGWRENQSELHQLLWECYFSVSQRQDWENLFRLVPTFIDMYWLGAAHPHWSLQAAEQALAISRNLKFLEKQSVALASIAAILDARGDTNQAMVVALEAVATADQYMIASQSSQIRELVNISASTARELAVSMAIRHGDAPMVAELLESSRLQVLPDTRSAPSKQPSDLANPSDSDLSNLATAWQARLSGLKPISVAGLSRIQPWYPWGRQVRAIPLEYVIELVGGPEAWWWGAWLTNGQVYWGLWDGSDWSCGAIPLNSESEKARRLGQALEESLINGMYDQAEILSGDWCSSPDREYRLSSDLGALLIPNQLREAFAAGRATRERPISLVLSGNLFGFLPVACLGTGVGNGQGAEARLIENAVIRVSPPAILVERIANHPRRECEARPVTLACVNPTGDLKHADKIPKGAARVLRGPAEATRGSVVGALQDSGACSPGLFYYSGHGKSGGQGGDLGDALQLGDGILSATDIFSDSVTGWPSIPFPERSLLSACNLSGSRGAGAGEWLGISAAILWAGSLQVVATNWPIWDSEFTSNFELELAQRLRTHDSATALRELQMDWLDTWRDEGRDIQSFDRTPYPLTWAAYCCLGIQ